MSKGRRKFTDEFKPEAVKLCQQPGAVVSVPAHAARADFGPGVRKNFSLRQESACRSELQWRPGRASECPL